MDEGNVWEILFDYHVNNTKNIGIENEEDDVAQHQDIDFIAYNYSPDTFQFEVVDEVQVYKKLKKINPKKATGPHSYYKPGGQLWHYYIKFPLKFQDGYNEFIRRMITCKRVTEDLRCTSYFIQNIREHTGTSTFKLLKNSA